MSDVPVSWTLRRVAADHGMVAAVVEPAGVWRLWQPGSFWLLVHLHVQPSCTWTITMEVSGGCLMQLASVLRMLLIIH